MSALSEGELGPELMDSPGSLSELPTEKTEVWMLAQQSPEDARRANVSSKILFLAAQEGMSSTDDWELKARWVGAYLQAIGKAGDY